MNSSRRGPTRRGAVRPFVLGEGVVFDVAEKCVVKKLLGHRMGIVRLDAPQDDRQVVTASQDGTIWLWDVPCERVFKSLFGDLQGFTRE